MKLRLFTEPENEFDSDAIAVYFVIKRWDMLQTQTGHAVFSHQRTVKFEFVKAPVQNACLNSCISFMSPADVIDITV